MNSSVLFERFNKLYTGAKTVNPDIIEHSCILYLENKDKKYNHTYLKNLRFTPKFIAIVLNIVECMKDTNHACMPDYEEQIGTLREIIKSGDLTGLE